MILISMILNMKRFRGLCESFTVWLNIYNFFQLTKDKSIKFNGSIHKTSCQFTSTRLDGQTDNISVNDRHHHTHVILHFFFVKLCR